MMENHFLTLVFSRAFGERGLRIVYLPKSTYLNIILSATEPNLKHKQYSHQKCTSEIIIPFGQKHYFDSISSVLEPLPLRLTTEDRKYSLHLIAD